MAELKPQIIVDEILTKQVAAALLSGCSMQSVAKELDISLYLVRKIAKSKAFKDLVTDVGDTDLKAAVTKARQKIVRLLDKAIAVLEHQLKLNNLDAAKIVFKAGGLEETEGEQETSITVIMPGAQEEYLHTKRAIEVATEVRDQLADEVIIK